VTTSFAEFSFLVFNAFSAFAKICIMLQSHSHINFDGEMMVEEFCMKQAILGKAMVLDNEVECPLCKEILANPTELRKHRQRQHRNVMEEIKYTV
jgi:hypothetical protein